MNHTLLCLLITIAISKLISNFIYNAKKNHIYPLFVFVQKNKNPYVVDSFKTKNSLLNSSTHQQFCFNFYF